MNRKNNLFTSVPQNKVSRNLFDLSHEVKMSGKFGILYPVLLMDVLPGDTVRDQMTAFIRFAPMLAPVMHRIDVTTHFFFVPNRLLTDHWEDFITGGQDGTESPILPYVTPNGIIVGGGTNDYMQKGSLWDYFGLPMNLGAADSLQQISVLPFRAYAKIWNDYYRDPNLDNELDLDLDLQGDVSAQTVAANLFSGRNRMWEKDYFTSALPWAQRGAEVLLPLAGTGSVTYNPTSRFVKEDGTAGSAGAATFTAGTIDGNEIYSLPDGIAGTMRVENIDEVNITTSDVSINDFRRSLAIQRWLENNARGGGRYIEQIESHFNTRVPDFRLQRAEYLGGGKQPVTISQVLATAASENSGAESIVGEMAGHGISVGKSNRFTYRCKEHGWIIGILSVVPRTAYSQGIDRMWTRQDKYDHAWPELAHLGEQEVLSKEIFYDFDSAGDPANNSVFGYVPRYAEYKFKNDRIAGDFRDTLDFWHLGRFFQSRPTLVAQFTTMYDQTALEDTYRRIFAVQDGTDYLWMQLYHRLTAKRPLPYFGVPRII